MSNLTLKLTAKGREIAVVAKPYAFPKTPKVPEGYSLTLNGEAAKIAKTGGGVKYPTYIYLMVDGKSYYLPKDVTPDAGTNVEVMSVPVGATPVEPKAEEPKAEEPKAEEPKAEAPKRVRGKKSA